MRKIKWIGLMMAVVLVFFTGCSQGEEEPVEDEVNQETEVQPAEDEENQELEEQLKEENEEIIVMAEEFINQLNAGEYEVATENFDETMAAEVDAGILKETWESMENEFGDFITQEYDSTAEAEGYQLVYIKGTFNDRDVTFQVAFNENNEIAGFVLV